MHQFSHSYCIFLGFLSFNIHSTFAQNRGDFRKPVVENDARIIEIQNKLLAVQTDVLNLSTALASGDSSGELKTRLSSIENQFQALTEKLADERRVDLESVGKCDTSIALLTNQRDVLQNQLTSLRKAIERSLPEDIQDAIKTHKFKHAEQKLIEMGDNSKVQGIIHGVYDNSIGNVDAILDFSKSLRRTEFRLAVLKALLYEIRANDHRDPFKLIKVVQILESWVMSDSTVSEEKKAIAEIMIDGTMDDIKSSSTDILKHALYTNTYPKSVEIEKLSDALNDFRSELLEELKLGIAVEADDEILEKLYSHKNISQILSRMVALFNKLETAGNFNDATMFNMGDFLRKLQGRDTYSKVNAALKGAVETVISKLPTCVRSIFFEPYVCIYNRQFPDFGVPNSPGSLYASEVQAERFQGPDVLWKVTKSGDKFYFESFVYPKHYLYGGNIATRGYRHFVHAILVKGDQVCNKAAWNIELNGDFCYLKNVDTKEYMYAALRHPISILRNVYTWTPGTEVRIREYFQWQLKKCP